MKTAVTLKVVATIVATLGLALYAVDSQAALNLSVSPISGGNNLRFGRVSLGREANQEVRIRITSTDGNQYQVFHRMVDPFLNEKSISLGMDTISTYTLSGSNGSGTLYAQSPEQMGFADQLLYTSGSGGTSDMFTLVYAVDGSRISASGNFFGRIQYTVRPVGGSTQDSVILNVTIEASGELKIEIDGSSGIDLVRLNHQNNRDKEGYVQFKIRDNLGQEIQIFQESEPFPQDELLNEIGKNAILFIASGSTRGELQPKSLNELTRKRILVYSSKENEDSFQINLVLNQEEIERQKSGTYKGQLKYVVVTDQKEQLFTIQLEVEVEPVFSIEIDLPSGGLSFERLLPDSQPMVREVAVEVKTNLGRPYMVMQNVVSPLTNDKGDEMPDQYFTYKGELANNQNGKIFDTDYKQVPRGESLLFASDQMGAPSQFKVGYRLRPYLAMVPGSYTTSIRYSLGEL